MISANTRKSSSKTIIVRRFKRGIKSLFDIYPPIVDGALIFDNSEGKYQLLAEKMIEGNLNILQQLKFELLKHYYDHH